MWSFACILPELRFGDVLISGHSEDDQLCAISEIIGPPPMGMLSNSKKIHLVDPQTSELVYTRKKNGKLRKPFARPLWRLIPKRTDTFLKDFLSFCLQWNPEDRPTPLQALHHVWFNEN